jgi:hypothetical protein
VSRALLAALAACGGGSVAPVPTAEPPRGSAIAPRQPAPLPTAAEAYAETLAPDVVGKLAVVAPTPGEYTMTLALEFSTFVTMEMQISESRSGALRLSLRADRSVRVCLGVRRHSVVNGQYHYKPPGQREHREDDNAYLLGASGIWSVTDGIAEVRLDRVESRCDFADAPPTASLTQTADLRCIATTGGSLPPNSLVCDAAAQSIFHALGLPMTIASRPRVPTRAHNAPQGQQVVLGAPGVAVEIRQDRHDELPRFTFTPGAQKLDEARFQRPKPNR